MALEPGFVNTDKTLLVLNGSPFPVVGVNWCQAYGFCKSAGKRLCGRIGGGANAFTDYASAAASQWYNACSKVGTQASRPLV